LYLGVWIQKQHAVVAVNQTDGRRYLQLAASRFVDQPTSHPRLEEMKFCLR
jgi:hypothetical protein